MTRPRIWLVVALLAAEAASAQDQRSPSKTEAALLRELEARYAQCMDAARRGDLPAYWRLRTAASRTRPPVLDAGRIRLLAELLPPLQSLEFVRLDANPKTARTLYRWRTEDVAQYSVVVYRLEQGAWKLDDVSVRRSVAKSPAATAGPRPLPSPAPSTPAAPAPTAGDHPDPQAQALLRAWESGRPDPARSLGAPRL
jgi:hypothetical protein